MNCLRVLVLVFSIIALFITHSHARVRHPPIHAPAHEPRNMTIWDILCTNPDLEKAHKAFKAAGLQSLLSSLEPSLTLFVPDNRAFNHMSDDLRDYFDNDKHREVLTGVALHHLVQGRYTSPRFQDQMTMVSLAGIPLRVMVRMLIESTSIVSVNQATITSKDMNAANGVIHIVDSILIPNKFALITSNDDDKNSSLAKIMCKNEKISLFYHALKETKLLDMFEDDSTQYTIFAPEDDAWHGAYVKLLDGNHGDRLKDVLKYHIVPKQRLFSIDFRDDARFATYQGKSMRASRNRFLSKHMDRIFVDNGEVIKTDRIGRNGVLHIIDRVLLP